jgi:hypothetical protein
MRSILIKIAAGVLAAAGAIVAAVHAIFHLLGIDHPF